MASQESPRPGDVLAGRFELLEPIGRGGMGEVYLARQIDTGRKAVIKFIRQDTDASEAMVARFRREARILAELSHPNIVGILGFGEDGHNPWLAMEYIRGQSLGQVLKEEGRLEPARTLRLGEQLLGALAEAHSRELIHRDLKPDNLMLAKKAAGVEVLKVVDFGIARRIAPEPDTDSHITVGDRLIGTPAFMSPEQIDGIQVDARTDVYAAGLLLFEMLTGKHPLTADTPMQFLVKHLSETPRTLEDLQPGLGQMKELEQLVQRALKKKPEDRFQSAEAMLTALQQAMSQLPVTTATTVPSALPRSAQDVSALADTGILGEDTAELEPEMLAPDTEENDTTGPQTDEITRDHSHCAVGQTSNENSLAEAMPDAPKDEDRKPREVALMVIVVLLAVALGATLMYSLNSEKAPAESNPAESPAVDDTNATAASPLATPDPESGKPSIHPDSQLSAAALLAIKTGATLRDYLRDGLGQVSHRGLPASVTNSEASLDRKQQPSSRKTEHRQRGRDREEVGAIEYWGVHFPLDDVNLDKLLRLFDRSIKEAGEPTDYQLHRLEVTGVVRGGRGQWHQPEERRYLVAIYRSPSLTALNRSSLDGRICLTRFRASSAAQYVGRNAPRSPDCTEKTRAEAPRCSIEAAWGRAVKRGADPDVPGSLEYEFAGGKWIWKVDSRGYKGTFPDDC